MRLSKKEPTPSYDDLPITPVSFGPKVGEVRPADSAAKKALPTAVIGAKITFKGELSGAEDLLIEGHVDGNIDLGDHHLIIGSQGIIKANIKAKTITIEGSVDGDVIAKELITVKTNSKVNGNLKAERVNLEDGAKFRGGIDMVVDK